MGHVHCRPPYVHARVSLDASTFARHLGASDTIPGSVPSQRETARRLYPVKLADVVRAIADSVDDHRKA